ncbi:MAG: helix-turn-helix domain-containing protein [Bacteroidales bacterium]|nr:helix-turn-helix domain-containing protein [Bacteroidales bacterium]
MQATQPNEILQILLENTKQVLTVDEVARLTGMTTHTIYKYCAARKIPHYKSAGGKMTYFKRAEVEAWMCHTKVATMEEIESEAARMLIAKAAELEHSHRKSAM